MNLRKTIELLVDQLAPRLTIYATTLYLYLLRHTHLKRRRELLFSTNSDRKKLGIGAKRLGRPMSVGTCRGKIESLVEMGLISISEVTPQGLRIRVNLPHEAPALRPVPPRRAQQAPETDYYRPPENRLAILHRENFQCFYCRRILELESYALDHVVPRRGHFYTNLVAACVRCNVRKRNKRADAFLRDLYRQGVLDTQELSRHLHALRRLKKGLLKPAA